MHARKVPLSALFLGVPALLLLLLALLVGAGITADLHPLLAESATALALMVSAVALAATAAFPIAIAYLARTDRKAESAREVDQERRDQ